MISALKKGLCISNRSIGENRTAEHACYFKNSLLVREFFYFGYRF